jgi:hypothetical protein
MTRRTTGTPKQLPFSAYIGISVIGLIITLFCVYYYIRFIQGNVSEQISQKVFYIILVLFGISASAMIFGAMNSYGILKGKRFDTKFYFTGPVVGVILIVLGGFYLPRTATRQTLSVRVINDRKTPVTNGKVTLYFSNFTREQLIDDKGLALFAGINEEDLTGKIKFDIVSDGYSRLTFDTLLYKFDPIQLMVYQSKVVHISGKVTTADEMPIQNVEIVIDGTRFFGKSVTNGSYSIELIGYEAGDEINLVTSHKDYKDKTKSLVLDRKEMTNIDFVLQPLNP